MTRPGNPVDSDGQATMQTSQAPDSIVWVRRWRFETLRILVSLVVLGIATAIAVGPLPGWEVNLFRVMNDLPRQAEWPMWAMQQAGMVFALPTGAIILWFVVRNWRPPVALVAGGIVFGWTAARIIKAYVDRGRPGALIDNVSFGWRTPIETYGYLSGHAVVAVTLAVVLSPYMPRWLRWSLYGLAAVVCFSRMYMGAHFPLDVIGGAAFGVVIGSSVNLMSGLRLDKVQPEVLEFN
jgi:membrane-associated phospholipid phosphatase